MPKEPAKTAADFIPDRPTLTNARDAAKDCKGCDLWMRGTRTVFGEGSRKAELMLVGEQPGDAEDLSGHPFVGPAGKLLDRALADAGIDRTAVYVTNVVKHFKWERAESAASTRNRVPVRLRPPARGSTPRSCWSSPAPLSASARRRRRRCSAARSKSWHRGEPVASPLAPIVVATVHPSSILRAPDDESRHLEMKRFTDDLRTVARALLSRKR